MKALSVRIIDFMLRNNITLELDKEIYLFGLVLMLRITFNVATLFFIGFYFNTVGESVTFVVCSLTIRTYSCGFHVENPTTCYLISVVFIILMMLSIKFRLWSVQLALVLTALSVGIILKYAPIEHKNRPLEEDERKVYKTRLIKVICMLIFADFAFINYQSVLYATSFSLCLSARMILFIIKTKSK